MSRENVCPVCGSEEQQSAEVCEDCLEQANKTNEELAQHLRELANENDLAGDRCLLLAVAGRLVAEG